MTRRRDCSPPAGSSRVATTPAPISAPEPTSPRPGSASPRRRRASPPPRSPRASSARSRSSRACRPSPGATDIVLSRGVDMLLGVSCWLFAIGRMAVMGPGLGNVIIALLVREWVSSCHVVSAETRAARDEPWRGGPGAGCRPAAHHDARDHARHRLAGQRRRHLPPGDDHHHRGSALVPRPRRPAAGALPGLDGRRLPRLSAPCLPSCDAFDPRLRR